MTSRILEIAHSPFEPGDRFWLLSSLIGESIHPGELGLLDRDDPTTSIRRAREAAARKLGIRPEDILPAVS